MRAFSLLFIMLSFSAFAQDFEAKLAELEKAHGEEIFKLGPTHQFTGKYPNDDYVKEYTRVRNEQLEQVLKLHEEVCSKSSKHCLTDADKRLKRLQTNVATGLVDKKNQWAKEGLSAEERRKKEEEYKREADTQLNNAGRKPADVVTPEVKPDVVVPEVKPEVVVPDVKPEVKPETVTQDVEVVSPEVSADIKASLDKVNESLAVLEDNYKKNYADKDVTKEHLANFKALETTKLNMTLAVYKNLCEKYPGNKAVCLSDEVINAMKDGVESNNCLMERKHQMHETKVTPDISNHHDEWKALNPKECKALLAADKVHVPKTDTPVVEGLDQEAEDKRNYVADGCVWVTSIPRKVVTGVTCGKSKNNICIGYVSCPRKTGGGSFTRMSTCRASYCGNEDAVKCTKDPGYWSRKPTGEDKEYVSPEVKNILRTSRQ